MADGNMLRSRSEASTPTGRAARSSPVMYFVLLTLQTAGAIIILANGGPVYRQMVSDFANHQPQRGVLWWAVAGVVLIHSAYWTRVRLQVPLPEMGNVVVGHAAAFIARLSFILASSTFAVIFLIRFDQLSLPPRRVVLIIAILFSMFCWTLELERLAKSLHGTGD